MRVHLHGTRPRAGRHTLFVAPAADGAEDAAFRDASGKPLTIAVVFEAGRASVPEPLGRYLVARGLAHATARPALILPRS